MFNLNRQMTIQVQPSDIIIIDATEVSNGVRVTFYVQLQSGNVLSATALLAAVNVS